MSDALSEEKKQQVIALGKLGWSLRKIERETGVRRETASAYLKTVGIAVRIPRAWGRRAPAKPANEVTPDPSNLPVSQHGWHASPCCQQASSQTCRPFLPTERQKRPRAHETDFERARSFFLACRLRMWRWTKALRPRPLGKRVYRGANDQSQVWPGAAHSLHEDGYTPLALFSGEPEYRLGQSCRH
jgi:hypothetical protein